MRLSVLLCSVFLLAVPPTAASSPSTTPVVSGYSDAPYAMLDFAFRNPYFMKTLRAHKSKGPLKFTPELLKMIQDVNQEGNSQIKWTSDRTVWGRNDYWDFPCEQQVKLFDDCDGFTLWKLRRLIELGLPSSALFFTFVNEEFDGGHAVLVVSTDHGDYVLDNRFATVHTVAEMVALNYVFVGRPVAGDNPVGKWVEYKPTRAPVPRQDPTVPVVKLPPKAGPPAPPMCLPR